MCATSAGSRPRPAAPAMACSCARMPSTRSPRPTSRCWPAWAWPTSSTSAPPPSGPSGGRPPPVDRRDLQRAGGLRRRRPGPPAPGPQRGLRSRCRPDHDHGRGLRRAARAGRTDLCGGARPPRRTGRRAGARPLLGRQGPHGRAGRLLLEAAGVEREAVVADYAATQQRMEGVVARLSGSDAYQRWPTRSPPSCWRPIPRRWRSCWRGSTSAGAGPRPTSRPMARRRPPSTAGAISSSPADGGDGCGRRRRPT